MLVFVLRLVGNPSKNDKIAQDDITFVFKIFNTSLATDQPDSFNKTYERPFIVQIVQIVQMVQVSPRRSELSRSDRFNRSTRESDEHRTDNARRLSRIG